MTANAHNRNTIVGVVVAVLLFGGIYLSRLVNTGTAVEGEVTSGQSTGELDVSQKNGTMKLGPLVADVVVSPRPPLPMTNLTFEFVLKDKGAPVDSARLSFNMKMDMGPHDYSLIAAGDGRWLAKDVVLPTCPSGGRLWFGTLAARQDDQEHRGRFRIELARHL
ncbi:MAG: hypothetical protein A2289_13430 [Deltaproteobacteria bacterium RIFOXYA12_FULL_58_15]|nr:MAG: hypothetical protein A2289_13430 [Deltaproteobacteria bacterium RIFOXYA12_FULL_58_15]OGR13794.1 MAG: hypothetical protein A2341_27485 [Deltaproteobacteria bacterium RIFOXYB12_FULL_58_9]